MQKTQIALTGMALVMAQHQRDAEVEARVAVGPGRGVRGDGDGHQHRLELVDAGPLVEVAEGDRPHQHSAPTKGSDDTQRHSCRLLSGFTR